MAPEEWAGWANGKPPEIKYPDKTDTDLAVEVWFGVHGGGEERRKSLGSRYNQVQQAVGEISGSVPAFVTATKAYLKKYGCKNLV